MVSWQICHTYYKSKLATEQAIKEVFESARIPDVYYTIETSKLNFFIKTEQLSIIGAGAMGIRQNNILSEYIHEGLNFSPAECHFLR